MSASTSEGSDPEKSQPRPDVDHTAAAAVPGPATSTPSHNDIPDGGTEAWLQVLGSWVILVDTWGLVNTFGVFQDFYERELLVGVSASDISWVGSLQGALLMMGGIISGPLFDAGYFKHELLVGIFLIVLGQFMTSLATQYWHVVIAQGICIGLGCGLTFLPSTAILSQYFQRRRAFVMGIASTGSPLAGMLFPIAFARLEPLVGFGWACRFIAFVLLVLSIVPAIFMHARIPPSGQKRSLVDMSAFKDGPFCLMVAGSFCGFLTLYVAFFYIQVFAVRHSIGPEYFAPYFVTLLNAGSVPGRIVPNYLADKLGALNVMIAVLVASAVVMWGWLGIINFGGLVVFSLLYGLFSGGVVSMTPTVVVKLTTDMSRVGTRMGMLMFASGTTLLIGTPIAGAILGDFSRTRWLATIGYGAAGLTLSSLCFCAAKVVTVRKLGAGASWK
ncbi:major facilitator superfamily transporter [Plectosphaerella cucumerina]|jgi:MFS family permease|uniref:Major facilitator superfamily transporter n=1 Tax=Plectosphaerella cucumerina TaxID=40658 RepID=A0A8K0T654_9PEZI|nr:major facilitator superfamily transporter [Plectosphaerella cucumerina]